MYKIFCIGVPGSVGGASTECLHTLLLWRKFGCDVTVIPTWQPLSSDDPWIARLDYLGIKIGHCRGELHVREDLPQLAGQIVVGFCNPNFVRVLGRLKVMDCRTIYLPLMNWAVVNPDRRIFTSSTGFPDAMVYQSNFQAKCMRFNYKNWPYSPKLDTVIRGAFDTTDWPYEPNRRNPDDPFTIIRISRPDPDKWASNYYQILDAVDCPSKRAILMGVNDESRVKLGPPPPYVKAVSPGSISPTQRLYALAHVHLCTNGPFDRPGFNGTPENAPMVLRESYAAGVPVIAPNAFGWPELIIHGETGFLANNDAELSNYATILSRDEERREHLSTNARRHLTEVIANPETLWSQWRRVFEKLS